MTRFMFISQWALMVAICAFAFRDSYRAHRITRFTVLFTWALLSFHTFVFSFYGTFLGSPASNDFPDGSLILGFLLLGWLHGLIIAVLAVGSWRALHGVPLFKCLTRNEKLDT